MQAVVKTPRIEIQIRGDIPPRLITLLKEEYGRRVKITPDDDDELVSIFDTEWYRDIKKSMLPGETMAWYRTMNGYSQKKLGDALGGIRPQHVSNMERGTRAISKETAKKLAKLFAVSVEHFI